MEVKSDVCRVEGETQAGSDAEQVSPASADRVPNRIPLDGRRALQTHAFWKENTIRVYRRNDGSEGRRNGATLPQMKAEQLLTKHRDSDTKPGIKSAEAMEYTKQPLHNRGKFSHHLHYVISILY